MMIITRCFLPKHFFSSNVVAAGADESDASERERLRKKCDFFLGFKIGISCYYLDWNKKI